MNNEYVDYSDIVADWGYEILAHKTFGEWQGDLVYLLSHGNRIGLAVIGYGSCTGCDALLAADDWGRTGPWRECEPIMELSRSLRESVRWFNDRAGLLAWLETVENRNDWWFYDADVLAYVRELAEEAAGEATA